MRTIGPLRWVLCLLAAAWAAQACRIQAAQQEQAERSAVDGFWREHERWLSEARKRLRGGDPFPPKLFDELFDDDFFRRRFDPFAEMEGFHRKMSPSFPERDRDLLERSWSGWLEDRLGVSSLSPRVEAAGSEIVLSLRIPGLEGESLSIDVNDDRIRISYSVRSVSEREEGGLRSRSESVRRFEKVMSIPEGADPRSSRVVRDGDTVRIRFRRAASPGRARGALRS